MFKVMFGWTAFILLALDLVSLILVGRYFGVLSVLGLLLLNSVVGVLLIRREGMDTFRRLRRKFLAGELPALEALEGVVVLLAGVLFFVPGFVSDALALLLLVPPLRRRLLLRLLPRWLRPSARTAPRRGPVTLSGEYRRED